MGVDAGYAQPAAGMSRARCLSVLLIALILVVLAGTLGWNYYRGQRDKHRR